MKKKISELNQNVKAAVSPDAQCCTRFDTLESNSLSSEALEQPSKFFSAEENSASLYVTAPPEMMPWQITALKNAFQKTYPDLSKIKTVYDQVDQYELRKTTIFRSLYFLFRP